MDDNFPLQVVKDPPRKDALLDLVLTNKKRLASDMKHKGSLGCIRHKMLEFKILEASKRV